MTLHSTVLTAWVLLLGATVPCFAEEAPKQTFTCIAKTFNECLMEAPCSAWKRLGPKGYKLASTTLADLFKLHVRTYPFVAVRASLRRHSSDESDDGVTDGRQAWLRRRSVDSFFPISLF